MVAELQLTDPLLKLAIGGILVLGVSRSELDIFESSHPQSPWSLSLRKFAIQLPNAEDGEVFLQNIQFKKVGVVEHF